MNTSFIARASFTVETIAHLQGKEVFLPISTGARRELSDIVDLLRELRQHLESSQWEGDALNLLPKVNEMLNRLGAEG